MDKGLSAAEDMPQAPPLSPTGAAPGAPGGAITSSMEVCNIARRVVDRDVLPCPIHIRSADNVEVPAGSVTKGGIIDAGVVMGQAGNNSLLPDQYRQRYRYS